MNKVKEQIGISVLQKFSSIENPTKKISGKQSHFKDVCVNLGIAPSYLSKLIRLKQIKHYSPSGKMLCFSMRELEGMIISKSKFQSQKS